MIETRRIRRLRRELLRELVGQQVKVLASGDDFFSLQTSDLTVYRIEARRVPRIRRPEGVLFRVGKRSPR